MIAAVLVAFAAALVAARRAPQDAELRRARLEAEKRHLAESFDRLEDRLMANQARVRLWRELRERHESVSAISCASQSEHAEALAEREEAVHSSLHRARVASAAGAERPPSRTPARR